MPTSVITRPVMTGRDTNPQYSEDFRAFREAYRLAKNSPDPHALLEEYANADNGPTLGTAPEHSGGYLMGFEIEYDIVYENSLNEAQGNVDRALFEAGLTTSASRRGYHSNTRARGVWSSESDGTVNGGELVSPVLADNRDSWTSLKRALEILKQNGGFTEYHNVGGHINIDHTAFSYRENPNSGEETRACFQRLAKMGFVFEDVMYRLATHTRRGTRYNPNSLAGKHGNYHRVVNGSHYASPLGNVADTINAPLRHLNRGRWLNLSNSSQSGNGRIEFRIFDGSLDWEVWQTRTLIASSFMKAATNPDNDYILQDLVPMRIGAHRKADWRKDENGNRLPARVALSGEAWRSDTERFRLFLDMLFDNEKDKKQVTTLFAMTDWNYASGLSTRY